MDSPQVPHDQAPAHLSLGRAIIARQQITVICFLLVLLGWLFMGLQANAQAPARMHYDRAHDSLIIDSLRMAYGQHKRIPPSIELQALRALSHYPELREVAVEFVFCRQKTAHSSQPIISTLLHGARRRSYQVRISIAVPDFYEAGMQARLPYDAQIGVLGHELAHTLHYLQLGLVGLLVDGMRYGCSKRFVVRTEHQTDQAAIDHGLGWQLLAWQRIARPLLEQAGRGQNYMRPEEIEAQL